MGWFKKKRDPISEKARALEQEIQALEAQIQQLAADATRPQPRFRSSAMPGSSAPASASPIAERFERVDQAPLRSPREAVSPDHYNDLGVRKYDVFATLRRFKNHFKGPTASNPKLVNYLAAGSIQGLRPLRYEKRVARNRFIFFVVLLLLMLWGLLAAIFRH